MKTDKIFVLGCLLLMSAVAGGGTKNCSTKTVNGIQWSYFPAGSIYDLLHTGRVVLGYTSFTETILPEYTKYTWTEGPAIPTGTAGNVTVPDEFGETEILGRAFWDCSNMTSLVFPKGVAAISQNVFKGCSKLQSFGVDDDNQWFFARNGLLYKKTVYDNPYLEGFAWFQLYLCPPGMTKATIVGSNGTTNVKLGG